jgi:hypothetical protein
VRIAQLQLAYRSRIEQRCAHASRSIAYSIYNTYYYTRITQGPDILVSFGMRTRRVRTSVRISPGITALGAPPHKLGSPSSMPTGGIRQNLFEIYYFEKLHAPRARGARARSRLARRSVAAARDESTVNNSGSKLKTGKLAPWGIVSCFHRWVVGPVNRSIGGDLGDIIIAQYSPTC